MPQRRPDSPFWWISYTDHRGKRTRVSSGTADYAEAKALEAQRRAEAWRARQWGVQPDRTFDQVMLAWLDATAAERRDPERVRYALKRLQPHFTGMGMAAIEPDVVAGYKAQRAAAGAGPATVAKELQTASAAVKWCQRELGWQIPNPFQGRSPRRPEGRVRWATEAEAQRLLVAAAQARRAPYLYDFVVLGFATGMRPGEILGLEVAQVDLEGARVHFRPEETKGGRYASVPLNGHALAAVRRRLAWRAEHCPRAAHLFTDRKGRRIVSVKKAFAAACERAGLEDFHPHDLRRTAASWLVQRGVDIRRVAELLRHKDLRATMIYAHLAPEHGREAVAQLNTAGVFGLLAPPVDNQGVGTIRARSGGRGGREGAGSA